MTDTPTRRLPPLVAPPKKERPEELPPPLYPDGPSVPTPPALDDKEKVAAVKSPTGTPKVKPSAVKWWLAGAVGVVAGLELCAQQAPDPTVQLVCRIGAVAVGSFVGAASPGFRKR